MKSTHLYQYFNLNTIDLSFGVLTAWQATQQETKESTIKCISKILDLIIFDVEEKYKNSNFLIHADINNISNNDFIKTLKPFCKLIKDLNINLYFLLHGSHRLDKTHITVYNIELLQKSGASFIIDNYDGETDKRTMLLKHTLIDYSPSLSFKNNDLLQEFTTHNKATALPPRNRAFGTKKSTDEACYPLITKQELDYISKVIQF